MTSPNVVPLHKIPSLIALPFNEDAERALLGAILADNGHMDKITDFLRCEHFYIPAHHRIYSACEKLVNRGQHASPTTLKAFFQHDGDLDHIGGAEYLGQLLLEAASGVSLFDYGQTIYDLFLRRQLIDIGDDITLQARPSPTQIDVTATRLIENAELKLFNLATLGDAERGLVPFHTALTQSIKNAEIAYKSDGHVVGITTGFADINKKMGGLHPSDLIIIAGRPSMGKTALATNIAFNAARAYVDTHKKEGAPVAFFSLEMSTDQLATRILSSVARIPSERIRRGEIRQDEMTNLALAASNLSEVPLYIDDTPALSVMAIRARARRLKRQKGLGMIVVDYLQLMTGGNLKPSDNRVAEISEITRGLKSIAKELQVPVIALSQLSRQTEQRDNKRPQLSDLRESGSIEQDADVVMFVFREEYYLAREEPSRKADENDAKFNDRYSRWQQRLSEVQSTAEAIIAKQRHGPIGTIRLFFDGQFTAFTDLDTTHAAYNLAVEEN